MNANEYIPEVICGLLASGTPAVLATIVDVQGSSPRHKGTKMVVGSDGKTYGTVGGSLLEASIIKEANGIFLSGQSRLRVFDSTGNNINSSGMICGGRTTALLDYVIASDENIKFYQNWQTAVKNGNKFFVLTRFQDSAEKIEIIGHSLLSSDGKIIGSPLASEDLETLKAALRNAYATSIVTTGDARIVLDPVLGCKTVFCFGAGHVAVPTAHIASLVGFRVVVVDHRPELANPDRFPDADSICIIKDFYKALEGLEINSDSYIVIFTPSHEYDRAVLEQSLKTSAGYIGMISSRRKKEAIYRYLMDKGVKKEELGRVHSPIGVPIGGETPEEIAVSIVAEMISERARLQV
jgi:xanthine dehydrogenase accessory factor